MEDLNLKILVSSVAGSPGNQATFNPWRYCSETPIVVPVVAVPLGCRQQAAGSIFNYKMSLPSLVFSLLARPLEVFDFENPGLHFPLTHIQAHS